LIDRADSLRKDKIINQEFKEAYKYLYRKEKEVSDSLSSAVTTCTQEFQVLSVEYDLLDQLQDDTQQELKVSRLENWAWRGLGLLLLFLGIQNTL
jgi:hypothetical protein